jgi:predicted porin
MKKLIAALIGTVISLGAWAQDSVTLYGIADAGLYRASNTAGGSQLQLASGLMEGSRWGIRGNEDLGGGMRAVLTLESRFEIDTGSVSNRPISGNATPARLTNGLPAAVLPVAAGIGTQQGVNLAGNIFDRQAYVGLVTSVGGFLLGRQYTPAFSTFAKYDINGTASAASPGALGMLLYQPVEIRRSNALQYIIQKDGVSAALMYALGESKTATTPSSAASLYGVNLSYDAGPISVGFGYNTSKDLTGQTSLRSTVIGASYDFGFVKLSGEVVGIKDENPLLASQLAANPATAAAAPLYKNNLIQDGNLMHLGASFAAGPGTMKVSYNRINDKRANNADSASVGATYTYPFSKRTDLNFIVARVSNKDLGQVALGGNGFSGGITEAPGQSSNSLGIGLRHRF